MTRNFPLPAFSVRFFTFAILGKIFPKLFILYCGLEFINYNWNRYYLSKPNIKKDDEDQSHDPACHKDQINASEETKEKDFEAALNQDQPKDEIAINIENAPQDLIKPEPSQSLPSKKTYIDPVGYLFAPIVSWVINVKKSLSNKFETLPKTTQNETSLVVEQLERQSSGDLSVDPFVIIETAKIKAEDVHPLGEDSA